MLEVVTKTYILGEFSLEPDKRMLNAPSGERHLASRPFRILVYLIENRDRVVTRQELLDRFWQGEDVYDYSLSKSIGAIRKALDDKLDSPTFIETRYSEVYRYVGPLQEQTLESRAAPYDADDQNASLNYVVEEAREVKIVVEEEEIHASAAEGDAALEIPKPVSQLRPGERKMSHRAMLSVILCAAIAFTAVFALIIERNRSRTSAQVNQRKPIG
jgi:DNA-binding winged helix-turn-helix (wHTH) protein